MRNKKDTKTNNNRKTPHKVLVDFNSLTDKEIKTLSLGWYRKAMDDEALLERFLANAPKELSKQENTVLKELWTKNNKNWKRIWALEKFLRRTKKKVS
jgi:hypothetical protein